MAQPSSDRSGIEALRKSQVSMETRVSDRQSWPTAGTSSRAQAGGQRGLAVSCSTGRVWDEDEGTE